MVQKELSYRVIGCCMDVHRELGSGLLEQCYHNALYYAIKDAGLSVKSSVPYTVYYKSRVVGEYFSDLVVNDSIILELKSVKELCSAHTAQLINYLRISGVGLGFLVNFQRPRLEWKRVIV